MAKLRKITPEDLEDMDAVQSLTITEEKADMAEVQINDFFPDAESAVDFYLRVGDGYAELVVNEREPNESPSTAEEATIRFPRSTWLALAAMLRDALEEPPTEKKEGKE